MIELSEQQRLELAAAVPRAFDLETKSTYVLVREEAYERMQALLAPERLTQAEQRALLHAAALRAGFFAASLSRAGGNLRGQLS